MSLGMFFNLLMLAILWGSAFPGIKIGLEGLSAAHLTLLRFMVASLCFAVYLLIKKRPLLPEKQDAPFFFLLGLLGITIYHLALNYGQAHVTAGAASLLIATAPAITAVVAYFLIGDRLPLLGWLGIMISFGGVTLIVMGENPEVSLNPYALLILVSALVTAFFAVLQKRMLAKYGAVQVTAYATWAGTLPLLAFLPGLPADLTDAGLAPVLSAVYIGIFPAAVAYAQFAYAISKAPVTLVAAYLYMVPVFSMLFAWLLLSEMPSPLTLAGGTVAILGIVLVNGAKRRIRPRQPATLAAEKMT